MADPDPPAPPAERLNPAPTPQTADATPPTRPPTIYDVARAAGVASSTVSRAFSRPGRVTVPTADRIRQVAAELGYRANPLARALPTGRTSMIALVISDVTNPFANEIIRGAQVAAGEAGYTMLLADAQESGTLEREALDRAMATVDGIVLATSRMSDSAIRLAARQRPVIVLNRVVSDVPSVVTDNPYGMRCAVEHLAGRGHDRITYLAGPEASWADGVRWRALLDAASPLGLQVHRDGPHPPTVSGGAEAAAVIEPGTAVIAFNDLMAIGLIRALAARHLHVPRDVSVIGFDNIFAAELVTPGLTTVAAPLHAMGETAVRTLLAVVAGARPRVSEPVSLPAQLIVRGSTAQRLGSGPAAQRGGSGPAAQRLGSGPAAQRGGSEPAAHRSRNRTSPAWGTTKPSNAAGSTDAGSR